MFYWSLPNIHLICSDLDKVILNNFNNYVDINNNSFSPAFISLLPLIQLASISMYISPLSFYFWRWICWELERNWPCTKQEKCHLVWQDSPKIYSKVLCNAKVVHYSLLNEENKNNPRFFFCTVGRLTDSHGCFGESIMIGQNSNEFMSILVIK